MKSILAVLLLSACSLLGQAFTHTDPTWPFAYVTVVAGGGGGSSCTFSNIFAQGVGSPDDSTAWPDGAYYCSKIKNTSSSAVKIRRLTAYGQVNSGTPTFTGYIRTDYSLAAGANWGGASATTNASRTGGYVDLYWAPGSEPEVPANTDFYAGMTCTLNGASVGAGCSWTSGGTGYQNTSYSAYLNNAMFFGDNRDDALFQLYSCQDPPPSCSSSNLWASPILQQQTTAGNYFAYSWACQKIKNTSSTNVTISKVKFYVAENNGLSKTMWVRVRNNSDTSAGSDYGSTSITNTASLYSLNWYSFTWITNNPVIPANTDFYIGLQQPGLAYLAPQCGTVSGGTYYQGTSYYWIQAGANDDMCFEIWICN